MNWCEYRVQISQKKIHKLVSMVYCPMNMSIYMTEMEEIRELSAGKLTLQDHPGIYSGLPLSHHPCTFFAN